MKRRGFLKRLAGVATAAVVSERVIPDDGVALSSIKHPVPLHDAAHHDLTGGFGLAPAKAEGATILYDDLSEASLEAACIEVKKRGGILTRAEFSERMADSLNKAFGDVYRDYKPDGWDVVVSHDDKA